MHSFESSEQVDGIAIIGMSCRFPGARNADMFWQNLRDGVESISFFSDEELRAAGIDANWLKAPNYIKAAPVLEDVELFDATFFNINAREAEVMDPQQRIFLECAWEALENAGYDPERHEGRIGVYGGSAMNTYLLNNLASREDIPSELAMTTDKDYLTTRVSYKLNLRGPSVTLQTACSTALVAVHLACESLLNGECDMFLAGSVAVNVPMKTGYFHTQGLLSPDGHCHAFDAEAQGTIFGSGVGVVVLKRLQHAIADGDHIHAVIKGWAVNNDGGLRAGYTAPSVDGQAAVIAEALSVAEIDPETITYIETHGSGTALGDPIEVAAMTQAFRLNTQKKGFCAIGSVKTNVGHLGVAAGAAGLIKTVLSLKHKMIPASLHFKQPNPSIDFENSPFHVNTKLVAWSTDKQPRRAGVSSFGMGGTNAYVVLEEAPIPRPSSASRPHQLLLLSAKTKAALEMATSNLVSYLRENPTLNLADAAYTLQMGRSVFDHRRMLVCHDTADGAEALAVNDPHRVLTAHQTHQNRSVVFLFSGVGDHYAGMAQELYQTEPVFKKWVDHCCTLLRPYQTTDLYEVLYSQPDKPATTAKQALDLRQMLGRDQANKMPTGGLHQTDMAQPAVFVVEYALAQLLMAWGIHPKAMIGYSLGEFVAACLAGVLSLEDALMLVAKRAQMIQALPAGAMLAVSLPAADIRPFLGEDMALSSVLTPNLSVVAGLPEAVIALNEKLTDQGIASHVLPTTHAFHSPMMNPIKDSLAQLLQTITLRVPEIPYISNVTGDWITAVEATNPAYWVKHLCQPVQFSLGIKKLLQNSDQIFVEVGPGQSLGSFVRQHPECDLAQAAQIFPTLRYVYDEQPDGAFLLKTVGKLWLAGVKIEWAEFYQHEDRHRLPLPTYPFEGQRYWIEANKAKIPPATTANMANKKADIGDWFYQPVWKQTPVWHLPETQNLAAEESTWLFFLDAQGCGARLAERLEATGCTVIKVQKGTQFVQQDKHTYTLRPDEPDDYHQLLTALPTLPTHIVHLWSIDSVITNDLSTVRFTQAQQSGLYSLLFLMKAIGNRPEMLSIWTITSNAQPVTGVETLCPEQATLLGMCRVIPQEMLNITCHYVDIAWPPTHTWQKDWLAVQLAAELAQETHDLAVAYRGNKRWIQVYEPLYLKTADKPVLRQHGVYLITGGLGGIGTILARYLAESVAARIILTTRSAFPPRESWADWLRSHDDDDAVSCQIKQLQVLESAGAKVQVMQADAGNEAQMLTVLAHIKENFGSLHGVFHAAGITTDPQFFAPMQHLSVEHYEAHFSAKAYGLYVLENVLADQELDFCMLFSSLSAVLGGLGFGAYAPANSFVDAFTEQHNLSHIQKWCSINWDTWHTYTDPDKNAETILTEFEMLPEEAVEAFERVAARGFSGQLVNSTGDLEARLDQWVRMLSIRHADNTSGEAPSLYPRPELMAPYIAPTNDVEECIVEIWQSLLGVRPIGIQDSFLELGGHSLIAIQTISRLHEAFQISLPLSLVLSASTVAELALAVEMAIIEEIRSVA